MAQAPGASSWIATPNNRRFRRFANEAVLFTTTFYTRRTRFPSGLTPPSLPRVAPQGAALSTAEKQNPPTPHAQADFSNFKT